MRRGYGRVSTLVQAVDEPALEQQIERLKAAGCEQIYADVISGRKDTRPELDKLLADLQPGDELVVTRLDRLGRSLPHLRKLVEVIQAKGCNLIALDESIELNTAAGKFHFNMLGALAEMESDRSAERIRHGHAAKRLRGEAKSHRFGFTRVDQRIELNLKEYEQARYIIETYIECHSLRATITKTIEEWGWSPFQNQSGLRSWLTSPQLRGHTVYFPKDPKRSQILYNTHGSLISEEEYQQIQATIAYNRRMGGWGGAGKAKPLTGLVKCQVCGGGCVATSASRGRHPYYRCYKSTLAQCSNRSGCRISIIDEAVRQAIADRAEDLITAVLKPEIEENPELSRLTQELLELEALYKTTQRSSYQNAIQEIKNEIAGLQNNPAPEPSRDEFLALASVVKSNTFLFLSETERGEIYRGLIEKAIINGASVISISLKF